MLRVHSSEPAADEECIKPSFSTIVGRLVITLAVLLAIIYVGLLTISRTEGFRGIVRDRLQKELGAKIEIEKVAVGYDLDLILVGMSSVRDAAEKNGGFEAGRVEIAFCLLDFLPPKVGIEGVDIDRASIEFVQTDAGIWQPANLLLIASMLNECPEWHMKGIGADDTEEGAGSVDFVIDRRIHWKMEDTTVSWNDSHGRSLGAVTGLDMEVTPIYTPTRKMEHVRIGMEVARPGGGPRRSVESEFIKSRESVFMLARISHRISSRECEE